jgi:D-alanyl-D-alanine carboxypeptidase
MPIALAVVLAVGAPPVSRVTRAELGRSWHPGCPVAPAQLRLVRVRYRGFDGGAHLGSLVLNARVVPEVRRVFARLDAERFPIRRIRPVSEYGGSDAASMASDNTSGFNCRYAVAPGPRRWSSHAYGLAIDVNPVENPYLDRGVVRPRAGARYLDRSRVRPGMAIAGGAVVRAFAVSGWAWGGRWASPDYQHFSATGG